MAVDKAQLIRLGHIAGVFGVQGWVKVFSETAPRENILNYSPWYLRINGEWREYQLLAGRVHGKGVVAHLSGCPDRDAAIALLKAPVAILRSQLPAASQGEYYWADLEGLQVVNLQGQVLGVVNHLLETGANDVLVVRASDGSRECLIPYLPGRVVTEVDLAQGIIRVDWDPDY